MPTPDHITTNSPPNPLYQEWFEQNFKRPLIVLDAKGPSVIMPLTPYKRYYISGQLGGTGEGISVTLKDQT